jgi:UDP-N-acetylmuramate--alanine ligase
VERSGVSYLAKDLILNQHGGYDFRIENLARSAAVESKVSLQVPGKHNVLNALAAFAAADQLHLSAQQAAQTLAQFKGSERRFDIRGEYDGVVLVDDYGHHPTEIKASLAAARNLYGDRRLWALWQPHTYTRTLAFFEDYQDTFTEADQVVILDVYAAREERPEGFDMAELADRMHHPAVSFQPDLPDAVHHLQAKLKRGAVLLVFTAGDAIKVTEELETIFQGKD